MKFNWELIYLFFWIVGLLPGRFQGEKGETRRSPAAETIFPGNPRLGMAWRSRW